MELINLKKGEKGIIKRINASNELKHRLYSLGVVPGEEIEAKGEAPGRKTFEYEVSNILIALRDEEAKKIEIEKV